MPNPPITPPHLHYYQVNQTLTDLAPMPSQIQPRLNISINHVPSHMLGVLSYLKKKSASSVKFSDMVSPYKVTSRIIMVLSPTCQPFSVILVVLWNNL